MDDMLLPVIIALIGGASLGINRVFLGRLGSGIGAPGASVVNHLGGAIFIFFILIITGTQFDLPRFTSAPIYAYVGGIIGAMFVASVSWLIPRAGVMKTTLLLIAGQLFISTMMDFFLGRIKSIPMALLGLCLIFTGALIGEYRKSKKN